MNAGPAILVTGGAGYIGSHCCRALVAAGYHPVVYDNLSTGHRNFVTDSLVVGELLDKAMLARTFAQHDIVAVIHFAASSLVGEPVVEPQKYRPARSMGMGMPIAGRYPKIILARRPIPMAPQNR